MGDVAKGLDEVISRPGDIVNHPTTFFGKAAAGAAPFFMGPLGKAIGGTGLLPSWATTAMGVGGHALSGTPMNPLDPLAYGAFASKDPWGTLGKGLLTGMGSGALGGGSLGNYGNGGFGAGGFNSFGGGSGNFDPSQLAALYGLSGIGQPRYPDGGNMDKALGYADLLGNAGKSFLTQGQNGLPSFSSMGALGAMPGLFGQMADNAGVQNPLAGWTNGTTGAPGATRAPTTPGTPGTPGPTPRLGPPAHMPTDAGTQAAQSGTGNPYALRPHEQEAFDNLANMVNEGRQSAIGNLRTQFAAKGITDPRAIAAAEAVVNSGHDQMLAKQHSDLSGQAFTNRQNTLGQFASMVPSLYGAQTTSQQQALENAQRFLAAPIGTYQNAAQQSIDQARYAQNQLGQGLRTLFPPQNPYMQMFGGTQYQNPYASPYLGGTTGPVVGQGNHSSGPAWETGDLGGDIFQNGDGTWTIGNQQYDQNGTLLTPNNDQMNDYNWLLGGY